MHSSLFLLTAAAVALPIGALAQDRDDYRYRQNDQAVRACQDAVRQQASNRFGARGIEFRDAHIDPDGDAVVGMIDIPRQDYEDHFRFTCSMDFDRDEVRSVRLNPMDQGNGGGYRERSAEGPERAMDNCRSAVAGRIADQGYGRVQFDSMRVDQDADRILGVAHARRGGHGESFNFACQVEMRDGDLRSVSVTRR